MHSRLTVVSSVFRGSSTLADDLAAFAHGGATRVGLSARRVSELGLAAGIATVAASGLDVTHLVQPGLVPLAEPHRFEEAAAELVDIIDLAARLGSACVYGPTGGAPALAWDEAADRFARGIAPVVPLAQGRGIELLIEPTIPLVADISMLFTLADTVELAQRTGLGICVDVQHCWHERGLREAIRRAGDRIGLVQISDWLPGNRRHFRAVPGDGAIPLDRILGWILETGYEGLFDLELYPEPDVPEHETIARGIDRAGGLLESLGI